MAKYDTINQLYSLFHVHIEISDSPYTVSEALAKMSPCIFPASHINTPLSAKVASENISTELVIYPSLSCSIIILSKELLRIMAIPSNVM